VEKRLFLKRQSTSSNHCIQLTADQRAFNFPVSFCEVIYNQRHQAAATDAGRYNPLKFLPIFYLKLNT